MALNSIIPKSSKLAVTGGIFIAELNNPTIGKYDFTNYKVSGNRVNASVNMALDMRPNYVYFFHEMNFTLSLDEGDFLEAIQGGTVPELSVRDSQSRNSIFKQPFRLFRYYHNAAIDQYYYNINANNFLIADFQAVIDQTAALVGVDFLYGQLSMSIYEVTKEQFIKAYKVEKI